MFADLLAGLVHFGAAYALILVIPGTVMLTTGSIAAIHGFSSATTFIIGVAAGAGLITASVGAAINTFASQIPAFVAQLGSATLLLIVAAFVLSSSGQLDASKRSTGSASIAALLAAGFATALASPLTAMFATAMFSGTLSSLHTPMAVAAATLVVVLSNLCWYGLLAAVLSQPIARFTILRHRRAFQTASAAILICLAGFMIVQASMTIIATEPL